MATTPAFTVAKTTVELYKIRHKGESGCYWADITIDANGRAGRISIASDYGDWQNYWGACGSDFKSFLGQINEGYAATKFGAKERISVEGSIKLYKELLLGYRRDETVDADKARSIYEEIEGLSLVGHDDFFREFERTDYLMPFIYDVCGIPEFAHEPCPHFARFWKEIWPVLLAEFATERAPIQEDTPATEKGPRQSAANH